MAAPYKVPVSASAGKDGSEAETRPSTGSDDTPKPDYPGSIKIHKVQDLPERVDWRDKGAV